MVCVSQVVVDVNARDADDVPLLHWAAINDRKGTVTYLIKQVFGAVFCLFFSLERSFSAMILCTRTQCSDSSAAAMMYDRETIICTLLLMSFDGCVVCSCSLEACVAMQDCHTLLTVSSGLTTIAVVVCMMYDSAVL